MDSTSPSLLHRLRSTDCDADWARFVDLYAPLIFHWGRSQGLDPTDAADLVQEVLLVLVTKLPQFEYEPSKRFRGWLHTVTVGKIRDIQRRGLMRRAVCFDTSLGNVLVSSDVDLFEEHEYQRFLLNRALELMRAEFNDETWQACWLQVAEGKKPAEVAEQLGISLNRVYLAKSRILRRLRDEIGDLLE